MAIYINGQVSSGVPASLPGRLTSTIGTPFMTSSITSGGGSEDVNITGFGTKGMEIIKFRITPSGIVSSYDVEGYREDTFSTRQYFLQNVTTSSTSGVAEQDVEFALVDDDASGELHLRITNDDPSNPRTFDIEIEGVEIG